MATASSAMASSATSSWATPFWRTTSVVSSWVTPFGGLLLLCLLEVLLSGDYFCYVFLKCFFREDFFFFQMGFFFLDYVFQVGYFFLISYHDHLDCIPGFH